MFTSTDKYGVDLTIDDADVEQLFATTPDDADVPVSLSSSRNVSAPPTTACRYAYTYCICYDVPGKVTFMSLDEVHEVIRTGADADCTEALFTLGDAPDERYMEAHHQLNERGCDDIPDYLAATCEIAFDEGPPPHSNLGDLIHEALIDPTPPNANMGMMLETTADMTAHLDSRRKIPGQWFSTIRAAGETGVPLTTGIFVDIGKTWRDRTESLLAIRALHECYGHIQEIIIQNVVPNERPDYGRPLLDTMCRAVAMARVALPEKVSVQVPPNLSAAIDPVACGADDLGGVSPATDDYVNPNYEWPTFWELVDIADKAGVPLRERPPVYERFLLNEAFGPADDLGENGDAPVTAPDREWFCSPITSRLAVDSVHGRWFRNVVRGDGPLSTSR